MAGVSEAPYRQIALELGASAAPTELVSAKGLLTGQARTERYMQFNPALEHPFWVQLYGSDPEVMAGGAERAVALGADVIDINMGCPVKKVTTKSAGSALLRTPDKAAALVSAIRTRVAKPVTVKIRAGWDEEHINYRELGLRLEDAGCAAIAMHARTRTQGYDGFANWDYISDLVEHTSLPIIGNGDIWTATDARRMLSETGCAGVMIGRGALGNPWIFRELSESGSAPVPLERMRMVIRHFAAHLRFHSHPLKAVRQFRRHLLWYVGTLDHRDRFTRNAMEIDDPNQLIDAVEAFFSDQVAPTAQWQPALGHIKGELG